MKRLIYKIAYAPKASVIEQLRKQNCPLLLWGGGRVAEAVLNYLEENHITVDGIFVDDEYFVEGQTKKNIAVRRFRDFEDEYAEFNIIVGHSAYERGKELQGLSNKIRSLYYITSMVYGQTKPIEYRFVMDNIEKYQRTYEILTDDTSRLCMEAYLNARINEDISYVLNVFEKNQNYFNNDIYTIGHCEVFMDIGAYTGDTVEMFLNECNGQYKYIYAFEVNKDNFIQLENYVNDTRVRNIDLFHMGLGDKEENIDFIENGDVSGMLSEQFSEGTVTTIKTSTIDSMLEAGKFELGITMFKINFFVGTIEVLRGASEMIKKFHPKIAITVGFDEWGIITIPQYLKSIVPEYKIFLRYNECMPARLVMYAYC